jgi:hypothetical protein
MNSYQEIGSNVNNHGDSRRFPTCNFDPCKSNSGPLTKLTGDFSSKIFRICVGPNISRALLKITSNPSIVRGIRITIMSILAVIGHVLQLVPRLIDALLSIIPLTISLIARFKGIEFLTNDYLEKASSCFGSLTYNMPRDIYNTAGVIWRNNLVEIGWRSKV